MLPKIVLDSEQVFYLLNFVPAMKDVTNPSKLMEIMATVHEQLHPPTITNINYAKDIAEQVEKAMLEKPPAAPDADGEIPDQVFDAVHFKYFRVMAGNDKVRAIKVLRELTGYPLKESKDLIDSETWIPYNHLSKQMDATVLSLYAKKNNVVIQFQN